MSKKKIPSHEDLSEVTVEVPRHNKHRRENEPSDVVRHKHRRNAELSGGKGEGVRPKQRREADPSDVKSNVTRHKKRRDAELGDLDTHKSRRDSELSDVRVVGDRHTQRRNTHTADAIPYNDGKRSKKVSSRSNDYVFDNKAYVGSLNNVNETRNDRIHDRNDRIHNRDDRIHDPPTSVYREQYWACSKWSFAKKLLAITLGVALGAGIGLAIILVITGKDAQEVIDGIFQVSPSSPH